MAWQTGGGEGGTGPEQAAFDAWYENHGSKLFGGDKAKARQYYEQRKRSQKPRVAQTDLAALMQKAMG